MSAVLLSIVLAGTAHQGQPLRIRNVAVKETSR